VLASRAGGSGLVAAAYQAARRTEAVVIDARRADSEVLLGQGSSAISWLAVCFMGFAGREIIYLEKTFRIDFLVSCWSKTDLRVSFLSKVT
jgi:hypothetical protein